MITLDLRRIRCAKDLQDAAKGAMSVTEEALSPRLTDQGLLGEMYAHFQNFVRGLKKPHHHEMKREFLFIVTYLYCPTVLIGGTMPRGFRGVLKGLMKVESPSAISNYVSDLLFLYNHYQDFRQVVEGAYSYISEAMHLDAIKRDSSENEKSDAR